MDLDCARGTTDTRQVDAARDRGRLEWREIRRDAVEIDLRGRIIPEILIGPTSDDSRCGALFRRTAEIAVAVPGRERTADRRIRGAVHAHAAVAVIRAVDDAVGARPRRYCL